MGANLAAKAKKSVMKLFRTLASVTLGNPTFSLRANSADQFHQ